MKYALEILFDARMLGCKPVSTPIDYSTWLHQNLGIILFETNTSSFKRLIGRRIYLTNTWLDITFVVQTLSLYVSHPTSTHQQAVFCILWYIKGAPGLSLSFPATSEIQLKAFSDSDWAGFSNTRRSITGFSIYLGSSLITWKSKRQAIVSRSSPKVEYWALAGAACELQWLTYLLIYVYLPSKSYFFCDNHSTLHIVANPVFHERTKHMKIDCHIVCERLLSGSIKLLPIFPTNQLADIFTKALSPHAFHLLQLKLEMSNIHSSA